MKRAIIWLDRNLEEFLLKLLLCGIAVIILLQVVMRYVFSHALPWPEELSRYLMVYSTMLSLGYCIRRSSMLRIEFLAQALPKRIGKALELLVALLGLLVFAYLFRYSISLVETAVQRVQLSPALRIPTYLVYCSTVLGFGLAVIRSVQMIVLSLIGRKDAGNGEGAAG